jgi:phosphoribosylformimino-5-aminoimidazole carboxamide ribotide isomerase
MILFPAVDIKNGECVRLAQGKEDQVTVFAADPVEQARVWAAQGARFLHVVDLDGAFSGMPKNFELIRSICSAIDIPVQLGGGIRDIATARKYVEAGVSRLIIGTMALESPELFSELCLALPGKIGVSLDAVDGSLKTKGWVEDAGLTMDDVLPRLEKDGIRFIVYTDIARDGMQTGVNFEALEALCAKTSVPVIAAGGVHTLDDIKALYPLSKKGLEGAISGRAIYVGTLDVAEANAWIDAQ